MTWWERMGVLLIVLLALLGAAVGAALLGAKLQ